MIGMIMLIAGGVCVLLSIIVFVLYLIMGKAVGSKLMKKLKEEY